MTARSSCIQETTRGHRPRLQKTGVRSTSPELPLDEFQEEIIGVADDQKPGLAETHGFATRCDDVCTAGLQRFCQTIHVADEELQDCGARVLNAGLQRFAVDV